MHQRLLAQFTSAVAANDASALLAMFKSDVRFMSDGGGKRPAALRVLNTAAEVAQLVIHIAGAKGGPREMRFVEFNGVPSLWFIDGLGHESVMQFDIADDRIQAIFVVRNPDKLAHLRMH